MKDTITLCRPGKPDVTLHAYDTNTNHSFKVFLEKHRMNTQHASGVEWIELARHMGFDLGSAFRHLWLAGCLSKDAAEVQDNIRKAHWYICDHIAQERAIVEPLGPHGHANIVECWRRVCRHGFCADPGIAKAAQALVDAHLHSNNEYVWHARGFVSEALAPQLAAEELGEAP